MFMSKFKAGNIYQIRFSNTVYLILSVRGILCDYVIINGTPEGNQIFLGYANIFSRGKFRKL